MKRLNWQAWQDSVNAWEPYRRGLLLGAIAVLSYVVWQNWILDPIDKQTAQLSLRASSLEQDVDNLQARIAVLDIKQKNDPNQQLKQQATQLQQQLSSLDSEVRELTSALLPPEQMAEAIESVLIQHTPLQVIAVKGTGSEALSPVAEVLSAESRPAIQGPQLYRHGMRFQFAGGYLETLEYLKALEALPWRFSWDRLSLSVNKYPVSQVSLEISTLSLAPVWISL